MVGNGSDDPIYRLEYMFLKVLTRQGCCLEGCKNKSTEPVIRGQNRTVDCTENDGSMIFSSDNLYLQRFWLLQQWREVRKIRSKY